MPTKKPRDIPRGLRYVGTGRPSPGIPTRDLGPADLARLAYRRALAESAGDGIRPDRTHPDPVALAALADELVATGAFVNELPAPPAKKPEVQSVG